MGSNKVTPTQRDRIKAKELKMKRYAIGLITGILLTVSALMFMGASDSSHTHDATEIEYASYQNGGYGTLQAKIRKIDSHDHDRDYAEESHDHYFDYAKKRHSHY